MHEIDLATDTPHTLADTLRAAVRSGDTFSVTAKDGSRTTYRPEADRVEVWDDFDLRLDDGAASLAETISEAVRYTAPFLVDDEHDVAYWPEYHRAPVRWWVYYRTTGGKDAGHLFSGEVAMDRTTGYPAWYTPENGWHEPVGAEFVRARQVGPQAGSILDEDPRHGVAQ